MLEQYTALDETLDPAVTLATRWQAHRQDYPDQRIRDAARALGVGEAHLLATQLGESVVRLRPEWKALFEALPALGRVMASTRNEWAVIEKTGEYDEIDVGEQVGLVLTEAIDLRLFPMRFHSVFAVEKVVSGTHRDRVLRSVQIFDRFGDSVHKVYIKSEAQVAAYEALVARFRAPEQRVELDFWETPDRVVPSPAEDVDESAFKEAWLALQDTHEFFGLLRRFKVTRTQALSIAPETHAERLDLEVPTRLLHDAAQTGAPIMAFVGSAGCIEIHTGPVKNIQQRGQWINVLDPDFNLHLNLEGVAEVWLVKKPTVDGIVTSIELFDADGGTIVMFFGARKPGIPEDERWRELIARVR